MAKLTLAETRSAMSSAWTTAHDAAAKFGGSPRTFFAESLRQAYEAIRAAADRIADEMLSPGEKLLRQAADRKMRVDYIENHFQHREELKTIEFLEITGKAMVAAETAELDDMATYAAETRGPVYAAPAKPAPVRRPEAMTAWDAATIPGRVDARTVVAFRGICGHRRRAA